MSLDREAFGMAFKSYRESLGKTQQEIANKLYITVSQIESFESGKTILPDVSLNSLSQAYGTNLSTICDLYTRILKRKIKST